MLLVCLRPCPHFLLGYNAVSLAYITLQLASTNATLKKKHKEEAPGGACSSWDCVPEQLTVLIGGLRFPKCETPKAARVHGMFPSVVDLTDLTGLKWDQKGAALGCHRFVLFRGENCLLTRQPKENPCRRSAPRAAQFHALCRSEIQ